MTSDRASALTEALTLALSGLLATDGWANERERRQKTWEHADRVKRLLPVFADELDAVADTWNDNAPGFVVVQELRSLAETLRGSA